MNLPPIKNKEDLRTLIFLCQKGINRERLIENKWGGFTKSFLDEYQEKIIELEKIAYDESE